MNVVSSGRFIPSKLWHSSKVLKFLELLKFVFDVNLLFFLSAYFKVTQATVIVSMVASCAALVSAVVFAFVPSAPRLVVRICVVVCFLFAGESFVLFFGLAPFSLPSALILESQSQRH